MIHTFATTGAERFDLTLTNLSGEKVRFRKGLSLDQLEDDLPSLLTRAAAARHNVIVRPVAVHTNLIQLDDLDTGAAQLVQPVAFLGLETSPGNHQAWVAVPAGAEVDFARRLRKGAGADPSASGATRIAGSLNFKEKYAPNFPRVAITHRSPGRIVTPDQLEALGLVAAPETAPPPTTPPRVSRAVSGGKAWPSYGRCLSGAPPNHANTGPDVSRADFTWCMTAIDWGWTVKETAARLMEESSKAKENGSKYADLTARKAAAAVERRRGRNVRP
jgi:hypothetical protein